MSDENISADEARGLLDVREPLETAIGRTYGSNPTTERFVRVRGADFAVAAEVCGLDAMPSEEMAKLFAAAPALRRAVIGLHADNARLDDVTRGALDDLAKVRAELADTRAALRANLRCDECDELATRLHAATASFCCDAHAVGEGWSDTTHAAAVRAAMEGGR